MRGLRAALLQRTQVVGHSVGATYPPGKKRTTSDPARFLELWPHESGGLHQPDDLQRAGAPLLDEPALMEDSGDQGIPRPGFVTAIQIVRSQSEVEFATAHDFEPVVVDGDVNRPSSGRVVTMAQRVRQSLAKRRGWVERVVLALEQVRNDATGHRQVIDQELLSDAVQTECVRHGLARVDGIALQARLAETWSFAARTGRACVRGPLAHRTERRRRSVARHLKQAGRDAQVVDSTSFDAGAPRRPRPTASATMRRSSSASTPSSPRPAG